MDSPVKKLDFTPAGQSDIIKAVPLVGLPELSRPVATATEAPVDVNADEPLLRENPSRFVLFPIKYHEVCLLQRVRRVSPRF